MGSGAWSASDFHMRARTRAEKGVDTFDYSAKAIQTGQLSVHPTLNPLGMSMRESRDNQEHLDSNAIIISLDVTGSMGRVVRGIHRDLPHLHELLLGHKYIAHPQILFAAVGDATCDRVPLQVGQFESDNRMDHNLENMILEGGGGGQNTESYELTMYVAARHTSLDCWEKRGRKGYLFMIGDEMAYPAVRRAHVHKLIGIDPQSDIPLEQIVAEVQEKYHFFFIIPGGAAHGGDERIRTFWKRLIGAANVLTLQDPDDTSECIAVTIGLTEGVVTLDEAKQQMTNRGKLAVVIQRVLHAISGVFHGAPPADKTTGTRRL